MIVKYSDGHQEDQATLLKLQSDPALPLESRARAHKALLTLKAGLAHEARVTAALDLALGAAPDWWVFHDLRLVHAGWSAQFDHLLINRYLDLFICESKHVAEGLSINEFGEFTSFVKGAPIGIPSPFAQNARHQHLLEQLLATHQFPWPFRAPNFCTPRWNNWVLVPNGARVSLSCELPCGCQLLKLKQLPDQLSHAGMRNTARPSWRNLPMPLSRLLLMPLIQRLLLLHTPAPPPNWAQPLAALSGVPGMDLSNTG